VHGSPLCTQPAGGPHIPVAASQFPPQQSLSTVHKSPSAAHDDVAPQVPLASQFPPQQSLPVVHGSPSIAHTGMHFIVVASQVRLLSVEHSS
jgi:hypothetical protein